MERETFVPEAIPATDLPTTPVAPASEPAPLAQADDHTTRQIPTDVEVGQVPQSTVAEVTTPEPQPVVTPEPEQPRRGGSFFDQI
jgi:hypothetical protein